jgi:hypothetical protein
MFVTNTMALAKDKEQFVFAAKLREEGSNV